MRLVPCHRSNCIWRSVRHRRPSHLQPLGGRYAVHRRVLAVVRKDNVLAARMQSDRRFKASVTDRLDRAEAAVPVLQHVR